MHNPDNPKVVYLIRHAESAENVAPVFQSPDAPLSPKGHEQANKLAKRISRLAVGALITSPLPRAKETADAIAQETGMVPETSELFTERRKPTSLNGKPYADTEAGLVWRAWEDSNYTSGLRVGDGENLDDLIERADEALGFLKARPEGSLVVVTHGNFLRAVVARVLLGDQLNGETLRSFQHSASIKNTGITVLEHRPAFEKAASWHLQTYNDISHMDD